MTRKKLNLSYITNESMRKATFNKRKKGLVKKIHELSVLCGIEACAVIYSPFNSNPEVWPSNSEVKNVMENFEMLTKLEQEKKMVSHEGFIRQNISKTMESNNKKMIDNAERTMKEAMFQLLSGKGEKLNLTDRNREDLCKYIGQYLKELYHHKNKTINQSHIEPGESSGATNAMTPTSVVEPIISSIQRPNQNPNFNHLSHNQYQYQQQFGYPILVQDGIYNPSQIQNQHEEWLDDHMMNHSKEISHPLMDDNNFYYQQP
uniref:MADS-box protein AGL45-I n=1 Tax=Arabidopsis thaliana TaxID=3702 RepID=Q7XJK4_ARATH|nr:MADS-box protein AGL45-I [Arabidopsis thaliana]